MIREYRIYGLQRSGTYYLETLIRDNLDIKCGNKGRGKYWKHTPSTPEDVNLSDETFFAIHKCPYKWIESIIVKPADYVGRQTLFPAKQQGRKEHMCRDYNVVNLAKTYLHWYNNWCVDIDEMYRFRTMRIRYEDLLYDSKREKTLLNICKRFNIERKFQDEFTNPNIVTMSKLFTKDKAEMYKKEVITFLEPENIQAINKVLPPSLFEKLNYRRQ